MIFIPEARLAVVGAELADVRPYGFVGHVALGTLEKALVIEQELVDRLTRRRQLAAEAFIGRVDASLTRIYACLATRISKVTVKAVDASVDTGVPV